jgi:hypothetical protein
MRGADGAARVTAPATRIVHATIEGIDGARRVMVRVVEGSRSRVVEARAILGGRVLEAGWPTIAVVDEDALRVHEDVLRG